MQPGGVGILPQTTSQADEEGFWANRPLALWPYTQMKDPNVVWGDQFIFVKAEYTEGRLKVGLPNPRGWLAYALGDTLFVKAAIYLPQMDYYDFQSSSQVYCNQYFLELETLGPRIILQPGESTAHMESWNIYGGVNITPDEYQMAELVAKLGLDS
jgi:hypothetical protein